MYFIISFINYNLIHFELCLCSNNNSAIFLYDGGIRALTERRRTAPWEFALHEWLSISDVMNVNQIIIMNYLKL